MIEYTHQYNRLKSRIYEQQEWIKDCECNGVSYADGERGEAIRAADARYLAALEAELDETDKPEPMREWTQIPHFPGC